jgi:hypothetical protein
MHRYKAVAVIGLSVAAATVAMDQFPTLSNTHMILMNALSPGVIVFTLFVLSSSAGSLVSVVVAWALGWAVNTTFYYVLWRIALVAKRKIRPKLRNETPT